MAISGFVRRARRQAMPALRLAAALAWASAFAVSTAFAADPADDAAARRYLATAIDDAASLLPLGAAAGPLAERRAAIWHALLATAADSEGSVAHWRALEQRARAVGDHPLRRRAQAQISNIGYRHGDLALTRAVETQALDDARRIGDRRDEAGSLQDLGLVATVTGDPDLAERHFRDAIAIWETLDQPVGLARALRGLGRVHEARGRYPQALEVQVAALELMLRHGSEIEQSECFYSLAKLFFGLGDNAAGLRAADQAIAKMGANPPDFPLGLNLSLRSQLQRELGDAEAAVADGRAALEAFERAGSAMGDAIARLALGQALVRAGDAGAGLAMLVDATATARRIGERTLESDLLVAHGTALVDLGRGPEARPVLEAALAIGDELGLDRLRMDVSLALERLHAAAGRPGEALRWSRRAFEYSGRLSALGELGELGAARVDGAAGEARARFMALDPAAIVAGERLSPATPAPAVPARTASSPARWTLLLVLPTLVLLLGLVRMLRHLRRLRREREVLRERERQLESVREVLHGQSEQLRRQASVDTLTGAMTRTAFAAELDALLAGAAADALPVALMVVDVDGFKQINDAHGHLVGDDALRRVAGEIAGRLRADDRFGRFGGDEFQIAAPGLGPAAAAQFAESIRAHVAAGIGEPRLTLSIGIAIAGHDAGYAADALFRRADAALYRAKRAGRDRVAIDAAGADPAAEQRPEPSPGIA